VASLFEKAVEFKVESVIDEPSTAATNTNRSTNPSPFDLQYFEDPSRTQCPAGINW
jgi:hypothetical protein